MGKSGKCRADLPGSWAGGSWSGARMCLGGSGSRCPWAIGPSPPCRSGEGRRWSGGTAERRNDGTWGTEPKARSAESAEPKARWEARR